MPWTFRETWPPAITRFEEGIPPLRTEMKPEFVWHEGIWWKGGVKIMIGPSSPATVCEIKTQCTFAVEVWDEPERLIFRCVPEDVMLTNEISPFENTWGCTSKFVATMELWERNTNVVTPLLPLYEVINVWPETRKLGSGHTQEVQATLAPGQFEFRFNMNIRVVATPRENLSMICEVDVVRCGFKIARWR